MIRIFKHDPEVIVDNVQCNLTTIRKLSSDIFGGDRNGFAIVPAVSYGISIAARVIEPHLHAGDKILIIAEEFPSNVLSWRRTAKETGTEIITIPVPEDGNSNDLRRCRMGLGE